MAHVLTQSSNVLLMKKDTWKLSRTLNLKTFFKHSRVLSTKNRFLTMNITKVIKSCTFSITICPARCNVQISLYGLIPKTSFPLITASSWWLGSDTTRRGLLSLVWVAFSKWEIEKNHNKINKYNSQLNWLLKIFCFKTINTFMSPISVSFQQHARKKLH